MRARLGITPLMLLSAVAVCALHGVARADAVTSASSARQVRAAILVTSTPSGLQNLHPYVFYVLDSRNGLKPAGVEFVNPMVPYSVTSDIYAEWSPRGDWSGTFQLGARLTKNMGAYWEMNLDKMSADDMRQFDVLYMCSNGTTTFTPDERAKLLRFVDGGGTLWFEIGAGFASSANGPFLFGLQYTAGVGLTDRAAIVPGSERNPLLWYPFRLDASAVSTLRATGNVTPVPAVSASTPSGLMPIVQNSTGAVIATAEIGAGQVVVTTRSAGTSISDFVGVTAGDGNQQAVSGANFPWPDEIADYVNGVDLRQQADLMLGYNISMWSSANGTADGDSRRSGGTGQRVAPIVEPSWAWLSSGGGAAAVGGPALYHGCAFVVDKNLVLHCFNMKPGLDLDGDGDPDNGIPDYDQGASYDEIWNYDLATLAGGATGASAPTIVEVDTASGPLPLVVVTLQNGTTAAFQAFPRTAGPTSPYAPVGVLVWSTTLASPVPFALPSGTPPPAPAYCGGVLFAAGNAVVSGTNVGKVMALDPLTGRSIFDESAPDNAAIPQSAANFGLIGSSLAAGTIRDTATGALDRVVYVYMAQGTTSPPAIRAFWFSTSSEPLTLVAGTTSTFRGRSDRPWYTAGGNVALLPKIYARYTDPSTGAVTTQAVPTATETWSAQFETVTTPASFTFGTAAVPATSPSLTIFADYTLDWTLTSGGGKPQVTARTSLQIPDPGLTGNNAATGVPAITSTDAIAYGVDTSATTAGNSAIPGRGMAVSVLEQFPTPHIVVPWAFTMHNGYTMTVAGQTVTIPPRLLQNDATAGLPTGVPVLDVYFVGTPAYKDGVAYMSATGTVSGTPVSVLCAFKTNPDLTLRLNTAIDPNATIHIYQRNLLSSQGEGARIDLSPLQYSVDRASGTIRILSLAPPGPNIGNCASCSMPFVVQIGTSAEQLVGATTSDGRVIGPPGVDNLMWYAVIPSITPVRGATLGPVTSGPTVQGDTLWLGFANGVASFDADPGATDPAASSMDAQVRVADFNGQRGHLRWVWGRGGYSFSSPPVGEDNIIVANSSSSGAFSFEDNRTLIADSKRILEVNSAGEPVWSADSTAETPIVPGVAALATTQQWVNRVSFTSPSLVRAFGPNNVLVVDTGNNRVVRMTRAGNVLWQASSVQDTFKSLLRPGDPLTLNGPTDCEYWTEPVASMQAWQPPYTGALPNAPGTVDHYLIADAGNFRVIELITMYDAAGRTVLDRQVNFVSSTLSSLGQHYRYITADRVREVNGNLPASWQYDPNNPSNTLPAGAIRQLTLSVVSNYRLVGNTTTADQAYNAFGDTRQAGGGSLVVLNEAGTPLAVVSSLRVPDTSAQGFHVQQIVNPTSFSRFVEMVGGRLTTKYLLSDANGCYQLVAGTDSSGSPVLTVEWMLSAQAYYQMTGMRLRAASIRRLPSSAWNAAWPSLRQFLIVSRYTGSDDPTVFGAPPGHQSAVHGEVFVLDPTTFALPPWNDFSMLSLGYMPDFAWNGTAMVPNPAASILWRVPGELWVNGTFSRSIGDASHGTSTSVLEQPAYADRPL